MGIDRRGFAQSLAGLVGVVVSGSGSAKGATASASGSLLREQARLPPAVVKRIRVFYPPNYNPNGPQAFPQSNMIVLVDTDAGLTGVGQGGSPDTVRNVARSVIGKNAFDTEMIWQAAATIEALWNGERAERLRDYRRRRPLAVCHRYGAKYISMPR